MHERQPRRVGHRPEKNGAGYLEAHPHGSPAFTTSNVIDADSCDAAERIAMSAWRDADSRPAFSPLLTTLSTATS